MAGKGAVPLDKVVINIETGIGQTHKNIENLAKSLDKLKDSVKGGFNGVAKLADSLKSLKSASKNMPDAVENLKSLSKISKTLNTLSTIAKPTGLTAMVNSLEKLPKVFKDINPESLENVKRVSSELTEALSPLADKLQNIGNGFTALSKLAKTYGVKISKLGSDTDRANKQFQLADKGLTVFGTVFKKVGDVGSGVGRGFINVFKRMNSQIKQIGLSLLGTRTIFTMTRKAVSEYMQMDQELTKATQNLWRALGAQLAPAIEGVMYLFKQIVRVIYSVVYALTGIDLIARANAKALNTMGNSAKKTLGSLQKFDDLNVAEFGKNTGEDNLIELEKIDLTPIQEIIDWMKKLKLAIEEAWKNGNWNGVANVIGEGINGAIGAIDPEIIGEKLTSVITGVLDFISTTIAKVDWTLLGTKLREAIENVDWGEVWQSIRTTAEEILGGLKDFIKGLFDLDEQEWDSLVVAIGAIGAAFATYKIIETWNTFVKLLETTGLLTGASGITTIGLSTAATWIGVIALAAGGVILGIQGIIDLFDGKIWDGIQKILVGIALILGAIALAVGSMPILIAAIVAVVIAILVKLTQWIVENWEEIKKVLGKVADWVKKWIIDPIVDNWNKFVNLLKMAWDIVVYNWNAFWSTMWKGCKTIINWIIGGFEGMINFIIRGINGLSSGLRKIGNKLFDIIGIDVRFNPINEVKLPRLETGTNEIPYEGIYHLHPGEAVVPKKYNPALGGGTNEETNQKLDTLINLMGNMNFTNVVNVGNKTLYKEQQRYNKMQNDKYGTTVNI